MPYGSVGGMERLAFSFYENYLKLGFNVTAVKIIGLKNDIINFGTDEIVLSHKDFCEYSRFERIQLYRNIPKRLKKIIEKNNIDYTISFGDMANCFSVLTNTSEVKIASIHALKSVEFANSSIMNKLFKVSYRTIYKKFQKVVCISYAIMKDLKEKCGYRFENLVVIYNPHDVDSIKDKSNETLPEKDYKMFENFKVILFIGRLSIQKSPWHLIKAFSLLKEDDVRLVFIGDGDKNVEEYCKSLISELGIDQKVSFLGRKNNPYNYLHKAKILILTSKYEGTPNVIVEAIALNTPIVCSNCTDGILEMMTINKPKREKDLLITEAGIITPNLFNGVLNIPNTSIINQDEYIIAHALSKILNDQKKFDSEIFEYKHELLKKYDLNEVCIEYIN